MLTKRFLLVLATFAIATWQAQTASTGKKASRIEITLEQKSGDAWRAVDPETIFEKDDHIRFRFRTNFDGYLYVLNHTSSGNDELLYPRGDTGNRNHVDKGQDYQVPETEASFRISGPAGHEIVYWLLSPIELPGYGTPGKAPGPVHEPTLLPRCDDSIFRARGECLDSTAGARGLPDEAPLPPGLPAAKGSMGMIFLRQEMKSVIASATPLSGPVVYEFRISHR